MQDKIRLCSATYKSQDGQPAFVDGSNKLPSTPLSAISTLIYFMHLLLSYIGQPNTSRSDVIYNTASYTQDGRFLLHHSTYFTAPGERKATLLAEFMLGELVSSSHG